MVGGVLDITNLLGSPYVDIQTGAHPESPCERSKFQGFRYKISANGSDVSRMRRFLCLRISYWVVRTALASAVTQNPGADWGGRLSSFATRNSWMQANFSNELVVGSFNVLTGFWILGQRSRDYG